MLSGCQTSEKTLSLRKRAIKILPSSSSTAGNSSTNSKPLSKHHDQIFSLAEANRLTNRISSIFFAIKNAINHISLLYKMLRVQTFRAL